MTLDPRLEPLLDVIVDLVVADIVREAEQYSAPIVPAVPASTGIASTVPSGVRVERKRAVTPIEVGH